MGHESDAEDPSGCDEKNLLTLEIRFGIILLLRV